MIDAQRASFGELDRGDSIALIARNRLGRVAFTMHDRVDIEPISYAYADNWIFVRTSDGTKLSIVQHHRWVAFEVDEVRGLLDWKSVVVRGAAYLLNATGAPPQQREYESAMAVLQTVDANAFTVSDATPNRTHILRIHVDEVSGRWARFSGE